MVCRIMSSIYSVCRRNCVTNALVTWPKNTNWVWPQRWVWLYVPLWIHLGQGYGPKQILKSVSSAAEHAGWLKTAAVFVHKKKDAAGQHGVYDGAKQKLKSLFSFLLTLHHCHLLLFIIFYWISFFYFNLLALLLLLFIYIFLIICLIFQFIYYFNYYY